MDDSLTTAEIQLRAVSLYDAVLKEMDRLVAGLASYKWPSESQLLRARRVAIGILIIHSLHVSKAIAALLHVKLGNQTLILVRSQFEMAVKLSYIEKHPQKGGDFLLSDPFERYWLAKDYEIATDRFATIISDCKVVVKNNPGLVRYQRAAKRGRQSADFLAIREGLAFPSMREMILRSWVGSRPVRYRFPLWQFGCPWVDKSASPIRRRDRHTICLASSSTKTSRVSQIMPFRASTICLA